MLFSVRTDGNLQLNLNLHELYFSIFFPFQPLNSGECRQSFVGKVVTANTASHCRWEGLFRKLIKPLTCEVWEEVLTIPH